jgi:hypothetical protein
MMTTGPTKERNFDIAVLENDLMPTTKAPFRRGATTGAIPVPTPCASRRIHGETLNVREVREKLDEGVPRHERIPQTRK